MGWIAKSFIAMLAFVPGVIITEFFGRHYGTKAVFMAEAWFIGVVVGLSTWLIYSKQISGFALTTPILIMFLGGLILGTTIQVLLFDAIITAPNPGLPVAIFNSAALLIFLGAIGLAWAWPKYFAHTPLNTYHLIGVVLIVTGVSLISLK